MPDMDGSELVRRVRRHPTGRNLRVVALTAFHETYPNEFDVWLKKSVDIAELGVRLQPAVRRS